MYNACTVYTHTHMYIYGVDLGLSCARTRHERQMFDKNVCVYTQPFFSLVFLFGTRRKQVSPSAVVVIGGIYIYIYIYLYVYKRTLYRAEEVTSSPVAKFGNYCYWRIIILSAAVFPNRFWVITRRYHSGSQKAFDAVSKIYAQKLLNWIVILLLLILLLKIYLPKYHITTVKVFTFKNLNFALNF